MFKIEWIYNFLYYCCCYLPLFDMFISLKIVIYSFMFLNYMPLDDIKKLP